MTGITGISLQQTPMMRARPQLPPTLRFGTGEEQPPPEKPGKGDDKGLGKRMFDKVKNVGFVHRLMSGVGYVVHSFTPSELGNTAKRVAIYTVALTLMMGFMGPFAIGMIPINAVWGLTWDVIFSFARGIIDPPPRPKRPQQ
jgi:hypothetical protein